jgi:imidazolonepropionase-like amidohydrolase
VGDGDVIENGAMLVEGGRIVAVAGTGALVTPEGTAVVDLTGKTVIPALIDAHAHIGYEGYRNWGADVYTRENVIEHLERYAYYGFGAVFSAGTDPDDFALEIERAQEAGEVGGARFVFAAGMAPPGEGPNNQFLQHTLAVAERTGMTILRGAATPEEGRAAAREVAAKGIRFIKIWVDDRGGTQEKLGPEVYRAITQEARSLGLDVIVHQQSVQDMPGLLDAGVAGFLHGRLGPALDAPLAARVRQTNAFLVPNLGLGERNAERVADDPWLAEATPPEVVERLGAAYDARQQGAGGPGGRGQGAAAGGGGGGPTAAGAAAARERGLRESFGHLLAAGVDVVLGTDAGAVPDHFFGYTGHKELEIFVRLGMTPGQALVAATSRPAARLGLDDLGTLAPGKSADFVVLDANPLDDIRNTRTISRVYLRGNEVDRAALRRRFTGAN